MPDPSAAAAACSGSRATTSHAARAASSAPTEKVMRVIAVPGGCRSNRTMGEDRASVATRHLGRMPRPLTPDDPLKLKERALKTYDAKDIRNVLLVGHGGSGKTTLLEAMLYTAGAITRMGVVEDGNTVSDQDPDEQHKSTSVSLSMALI